MTFDTILGWLTWYTMSIIRRHYVPLVRWAITPTKSGMDGGRAGYSGRHPHGDVAQRNRPLTSIEPHTLYDDSQPWQRTRVHLTDKPGAK
jgi:hypothetical protein